MPHLSHILHNSHHVTSYLERGIPRCMQEYAKMRNDEKKIAKQQKDIIIMPVNVLVHNTYHGEGHSFARKSFPLEAIQMQSEVQKGT